MNWHLRLQLPRPSIPGQGNTGQNLHIINRHTHSASRSIIRSIQCRQNIINRRTNRAGGIDLATQNTGAGKRAALTRITPS